MEIQRALGRVEAKVDRILADAKVSMEADVKRDARIAELEAWRNRVVGFAAAVSAIVSVVVNYIIKQL